MSNPDMKTVATSANRGLPFTLAVVAFVLVFLLVLITATVVTFILPESFASSTRVKLEHRQSGVARETNSPMPGTASSDPNWIQTELEIIRSEAVFTNVIRDLDLNAAWGKKYLGGEQLKTSESVMILKARDVRPVQKTDLVEIRVFSDEPKEAARLANSVAAFYAAYVTLNPESARIQVIDTAYPILVP